MQFDHGEVDLKKHSNKKKYIISLIILLILLIAGGAVYYLRTDKEKPLTVEQKAELNLIFSDKVTEEEKQDIKSYIINNEISVDSQITISASIDETLDNTGLSAGVYVPVTSFNSVAQKTTTSEIKKLKPSLASNIDEKLENLLLEYLEFESTDSEIKTDITDVSEEEIVLIESSDLNHNIKLLSLNDKYYLDEFNSGAYFRELEISGDQQNILAGYNADNSLESTEILKNNITGVTALTRVMMRRLNVVKDPLYFSESIGEFLADADLTHVSNEVSFKENCSYSDTLFCSPPEFIETLKASGVDLVELTGNHNNDLGSEYNKNTINQYRELGWGTVGGGLNTEDAAKPYIFDDKNSKITFLAYNYPDSPTGGAIAGDSKAGANSFEIERIEKELAEAKSTSDFVVVNVQFWECYAYPNGYIEYPVCDKPIKDQEETFKKIVDLGADMVVGTSAHQPQTYELYKGKPIYYGLGNLYFDQTQWPGTERGLVLTNYFKNGELLQTKITPTVYDKTLQTRLMTDEESEYLLQRLNDAR